MTTHHAKLLRSIGIALAAIVILTVGTIIVMAANNDDAPQKDTATTQQQTPAELADTLDTDAGTLEGGLGGVSDAEYSDGLLDEAKLYN